MTENEDEHRSDPADEARRQSRRMARRAVIATCGLAFLAVFAFVLLVDQDWYGFSPRILITLTAGVVATVALAAVLMAVSFHSARTGVDEQSGVPPDEAGGAGDW